ncbi:elongation factor G [Amycolatopsis azurea]|uniref:GTP-binding protein n=1 Tax=Amycolatopsis azurea DSM 43854 TaxID=1238180 RepID=M2QBF3_9PSEU|nr:TetM/TetW/TetO/TetS family tetracycline resistance ribosomal protection protein [Amycolatopsis azurea]EMD24071.1 Oxytetracycline resistance protein OtrA [Amycolatopsis azurea DSM 43854]OOC05562.1 GTP-binding protein [Amycolatopsis azurea DSM 43854]
MKTLNLGILAHVDAGKTSLTERLLHTAGIIGELGSVDDGSTQTDTLALERARGITIKAAVVSFAVGDVTVNLIDTPGHPDFIAEVERALGVLDGAVLVLSAVEGVQAQTRVLMRTLRRLGIPALLFVNKLDRRGADPDRVFREIAGKLTPSVVAMDPMEPDRVIDVLAALDEDILTGYLTDPDAFTPSRLRAELTAKVADGLVHPVYFGSAITGAGVDALRDGIENLLPAKENDVDGPLSGTVFKVERAPGGEKIAYVRLFSGSVAVRDKVPLGDREGKVTAISVFDNGSAVPSGSAEAGRIAKLSGLDVRIGDMLGVPRKHATRALFSPPTLETVVSPVHPADRGPLHQALTWLTEQDPLIGLRHDEVRQETSLSLYGEVQKEVIQATLADEYGIDVTFSETTTICVEHVSGTGSAAELIGKAPNPFLATVGLRVEPGPPGSGVVFRLEVELGSMPYSFVKAVEDTVKETLREGVHGWEVLDCVVTMTHSGYYARQSHAHGTFDKSMSSTAGDFRNLTPLVLMAALREAGTTVHEPMHRFTLQAPADTLGPVNALLAQARATPRATVTKGGTAELDGEIPAAKTHEVHQLLPSATRGEGAMETAFHGYRPVRGAVPSRSRTDNNPLERKEYLLRVLRRV